MTISISVDVPSLAIVTLLSFHRSSPPAAPPLVIIGHQPTNSYSDLVVITSLLETIAHDLKVLVS